MNSITTLPEPEVILTHESDLDGLVSGLLLQRLAEKLFNKAIPLQAYHYHTWKLRELREKSAWVSDLHFEPRMDRPGWVLVDHHPMQTPPKQAMVLHDVSRSAGLLCYDLCRQHGIQSPELDRVVQWNNVSDLFLEDAPDFSISNDYANLVKTYQFWTIHALIEGKLERLIDHPLLQVIEVKRRIEDPLGFDWSRQNVMALSREVGYVDTIVGNNNLIIHQLLSDPGVPFKVLLTLLRRGNAMLVSMRSRHGEALKIAERLQGGGHPNACGATLPKSVKNVDEAIEYLKKVLMPQQTQPLNSMESLLAAIEPGIK